MVEEVSDRAADSSAQDRDLEWDLLLTPRCQRGVAGVEGVAAVGEEQGAAATKPQNNKAINTQPEAASAAAAPPPPPPSGTPKQKYHTHFLFVTYLFAACLTPGWLVLICPTLRPV